MAKVALLIGVSEYEPGLNALTDPIGNHQHIILALITVAFRLSQWTLISSLMRLTQTLPYLDSKSPLR